MVPIFVSIISILLDAAAEANEGIRVVVEIVGVLFLVFSVYFWLCVFVPRWRHMRRRKDRLLGTFGYAGFATVTAGFALLAFMAVSVPGVLYERLFGPIFVISCLAGLLGRYLDR